MYPNSNQTIIYSGFPSLLEVKYNPDKDCAELTNFPTASSISGYATAWYLSDDEKAAIAAYNPSNPSTAYDYALKECCETLKIPSGVKSIKDGLFATNTSASNPIAVISEGLTEIDVTATPHSGYNEVTYGASSIEVTFNNIVDVDETKGDFANCPGLTSITFPKNFTSTFDMGYVMENCNSLTAMNFDSSNINYTSIDGVVYSKDVSQLYYVPNGKTGSYTVPETVTTIQNNRAFKNCSNLEEIIFPSEVTKLNFEVTNLNSLKAMTVPASVTEINNGFQNCNDLVISGYENSYAELFASYYDVKFNKLANSISLNKNSGI